MDYVVDKAHTIRSRAQTGGGFHELCSALRPSVVLSRGSTLSRGSAALRPSVITASKFEDYGISMIAWHLIHNVGCGHKQIEIVFLTRSLSLVSSTLFRWSYRQIISLWQLKLNTKTYLQLYNTAMQFATN